MHADPAPMPLRRLLLPLRVAAAALVLAAVACHRAAPVEVGNTFGYLQGGYLMRTVDGDSLPSAISTSYIEGTVVSGRMSVNTLLDYQIDFVVRTATGVQPLQLRGFIVGTEPGRILFVGHDDELQFEGTVAGRVITIPGMRELRVQFEQVSGGGAAG